MRMQPGRTAEAALYRTPLIRAARPAARTVGNACFVDIDCNDEDERCCGGICLNVIADRNNCGACGHKCEGGERCCDGVCRKLEDGICGCDRKCEGDERCCDGVCRKVDGTLTLCGNCGKVCNTARGFTCCQVSDGPVAEFDCFDLRTDPARCGSCNNQCKPGQACLGGKCCTECFDGNNTVCCPEGYECQRGECQPICRPGQINCGGFCIPACGPCERCDPARAECVSSCGECESCRADPATGSLGCRSDCTMCEICQNDHCVLLPGAKPCGGAPGAPAACCGSCQICDGGRCRNCNTPCEVCGNDGICRPTTICGSCATCVGGSCRTCGSLCMRCDDSGQCSPTLSREGICSPACQDRPRLYAAEIGIPYQIWEPMWQRFLDCQHNCAEIAGDEMQACGNCPPPQDPQPCVDCINKWGVWHGQCLRDCDDKYQYELYQWYCSS